MLYATDKKTEQVRVKNFNRMWTVEMVKDGKGFTVALTHVNCAVKSAFRFDQKEADKIFDQWVKDMQKLGKR